MHWVVQTNLFNEHNYANLIDQLERGQIPFSPVKIVPFVHLLEPDVNPEGPVFCIGTLTMSEVARRKGWSPGSFWNEQHDFVHWREHYGTNLLNYDSVVCRFADVPKIDKSFFIRPCDDTKSIVGHVVNWSAYKEWRDRIATLGDTYSTLTSDTMVTVAPVKQILREYRFFVIDGVVVTGSLYKIGRQAHHSPDVDPDVWSYAQRMVDTWQPARGFVIDIALTAEGPKVIEINCLNSAGFYSIDMSKLVQAVERMEGYGEAR